MKRIRIFDSRLDRRDRIVYSLVVAFYVLAVAAMTWPLYTRFASARPLILGMPFSLFYLACWVVASFAVLLALFTWERRRRPAGDSEDDD